MSDVSPIEFAILKILPRFDEMEEYFLKLTEQSFTAFCQSQLSGGIAMQIRNEFKLWEDSELSKWLKKEKNIIHADDMSGYILKRIYHEKRRVLIINIFNKFKRNISNKSIEIITNKEIGDLLLFVNSSTPIPFDKYMIKNPFDEILNKKKKG